MYDRFVSYIKKAVNDVFSTMISLVPVPGKPISRKNNIIIPGNKDVTGIIGFAGSITASIIVHFEKHAALMATSNMLGVDYYNIDNDVKDAVGEITNMIGGAVKAEFSKSGIELSLSLPIVISGKDFETNCVSGDDSVLVPFDILENNLYVEFSFKE
ncbi:MAG: chemotaxis protein CheX [Actinobacteria bacterium]|nr:chemotaxis protein CheX [Actinomycetota bacterium]